MKADRPEAKVALSAGGSVMAASAGAARSFSAVRIIGASPNETAKAIERDRAINRRILAGLMELSFPLSDEDFNTEGKLGQDRLAAFVIQR
jgi:hypothetical protein